MLKDVISPLLQQCFTTNFFSIFLAPFSVLKFEIRILLSFLIVPSIKYDNMRTIFNR